MNMTSVTPNSNGYDDDPAAIAAMAESMRTGERGPAAALAMRVVAAVGRASGATRYRRIVSAHVDSCLYHGRAGLDFARRLVDLGGHVSVRTTSNVGSLDLRHPGLVRLEGEIRRDAKALMQAYCDLGCAETFTCAPYQITHRPDVGAHVAWAESNAIAFVNSVLGARTERYGDFLDIAAAITGLVPDVGLHTDTGRRPVMVLDCSPVPARVWESDIAWAALGAVVGGRAGVRVAALTGLPGDLSDGGTTEDRLKALAATAASAGGVALFHVVGVTPEAPPDMSLGGLPVSAVTIGDLAAARDRLSTATGTDLDAVSIGTPHFSLSEFAALARELAGGSAFDERVDVYVSTSRAVLAEADRLGYVDPLRRAGGRVVTDTCTYVTPILAPTAHTVMTNSGKWAWYAPGNLGVDVALGTLRDCVTSAREGRIVHVDTSWD